MNDEMERARDRRNILEKLGAKIPGFHGYLEREMRREVDKLQRDWLAAQVDRARFAMKTVAKSRPGPHNKYQGQERTDNKEDSKLWMSRTDRRKGWPC